MNKTKKIKHNKKERKAKYMENLTQKELQKLKKLLEINETSYKKINPYLSQSSDPQVKQIFTKRAQEIINTKQKLTSFLND